MEQPRNKSSPVQGIYAGALQWLASENGLIKTAKSVVMIGMQLVLGGNK
tara:strand:- start:362 stop:508 length:147 start_codon:yes stop_codon:yes gene_type:complete